MRAVGADHEKFVALPRHDGLLPGDMAEQREAFKDLCGSDSLREIGALRLITPLFRHVALPFRSCRAFCAIIYCHAY